MLSTALKLKFAFALAVCMSCGGGDGGPAPSLISGNRTGGGSTLPPAGPPIPPIPIVAGQPIRVLFIGNSLTQANNLAMMVSALAGGVGVQLQAVDVSRGGGSLEDHWNDATAPRMIDQGNWHFVVMQQGPSSLPASREHLRLWAARFDQRVRAVGGRSAMYMVWPEKARIDQFDNVRESYFLAAQDIQGIFLPAGEAWRAAWRRQPTLALYSGDDFHPSVLGSYVAALVITSKITSQSPLKMPRDFTLSDGTHVVISVSDAQIAQEAALEVLQ